MKVYEFRKDLKRAFDDALRGEEVLIERGGVSYNLTANVISPVLKKVKQNFKKDPVETAKQWAEVQNKVEFSGKMQFCKEGHPIPDGRTKCLGKGCKYS